MATSQILTEPLGAGVRLTLNRPEVINALSFEMVTELERVLSGLDSQQAAFALLVGAGDRGFCGGGDVKELFASSPREAHAFLETEYRADALTASIRTPTVSLMSGITMGGGLGMSAHCDLRIVTTESTLAMPETRIGLVPDVGMNFLLARTPGFLGEYLAVTGARFTGTEAVWLGIADSVIRDQQRGDLEQALSALGESSSISELHEVVSQLADPGQDAALADAELVRSQPWIDECFAANTLAEVVERLNNHPDNRARDTAARIAELSPIAVLAAFENVRRARSAASLSEVFAQDLITMTALLEGFDAREGIRALLIDKDHNPKWSHASIAEVTEAELASVLNPA